MKIALIGYGKMGRMIEEAALRRGHEVIARINRTSDLEARGVADADVCIDFTHPKSVLGNIRTLVALGKSMVIGTTGWEEHLDEVKSLVSASEIGAIYGSNFSVGVHMFFRLARFAAQIVQQFEDYDVGVIEQHHRQKVDSPSGTARSLGNILLEAMPRKQCLVFDHLEGAPKNEELHVTSLRCGSIPGTHEVVFDSSADTISLCHTARNREGFALGAVLAAEWILGRKGLYSVDDMMQDLMGG